MAKKSLLKKTIKKLKKRVKHMQKIVNVGLKTIEDRDARIAQLSSIVDMDMKPRNSADQVDSRSPAQI
jgi:hypothetical protein